MSDMPKGPESPPEPRVLRMHMDRPKPGWNEFEDPNRLGVLVDVMAPERMATDPELKSIYETARSIVLASENGSILSSPVEGFDPESEPLVRRLLDRFTQSEGESYPGWVIFPLVEEYGIGEDRRPEVVDYIITGGLDRFHLSSRVMPGTDQPAVCFSSFPLPSNP